MLVETTHLTKFEYYMSVVHVTAFTFVMSPGKYLQF